MLHVRQSALWSVSMTCYFALGCSTCRAADAHEIIQRATSALNADWAADPMYACVENDEVQKGEKVTSKTFEVIMIDGSDYFLPLTIDDQPLSPVRRDAEFRKLQHEIQHREHESPSARQSRIEAWKKRRDQSGELLLDFPRVLTFQLLGEEVKDGHPSYVFSATQKQGVLPATRAEKVLAGIKGKVWVEKDTMHPIHIECSVVRPVPVYGVLASVLPGTDIEIRMTQVVPSIWLIDLVSMKLKVAKIHVLKSMVVTRSTYTHYRPNASAVQELLSEAARE